ncbi:hypothetical protein [Streptomyces griseus]|uniref:hypothetical protein n=1 Tax=Streptomyces griseus TaxID=1911 RepID=UPI00378D9205
MPLFVRVRRPTPTLAGPPGNGADQQRHYEDAHDERNGSVGPHRGSEMLPLIGGRLERCCHGDYLFPFGVAGMANVFRVGFPLCLAEILRSRR